MKKVTSFLVLIAISLFVISCCPSCNPTKFEPVSDSGIKKASVEITTDANGHSVEQNNILDRLKRDNAAGSIKHLYVISAYSGQTLIYSTVKGKVTSSSKRLTPSKITGVATQSNVYNGFVIDIGGVNYLTDEILGDDGSYGSSDPYIYWFDVRGVYHQHYLSGGQIVHISDQPIAVKDVVLNMELIK